MAAGVGYSRWVSSGIRSPGIVEDLFCHRPGAGVGEAIEAGFPNGLSHSFAAFALIRPMDRAPTGVAWWSIGKRLALREGRSFPGPDANGIAQASWNAVCRAKGVRKLPDEEERLPLARQ
jgi:hypothetical protein